MSLEEVESIISDVDINKDGKLDYNEVHCTLYMHLICCYGDISLQYNEMSWKCCCLNS